MAVTALAASIEKPEGQVQIRSDQIFDPDFNFLTWAEAVLGQNWGVIIAQMCTDNVMTSNLRPLHYPCNIWYTLNPSPSG